MVDKILWQDDVLYIYSRLEQWCYLLNLESCNATTNLSHIEFEVWPCLCKADELIHVWLDSLNTTLHSWDGITLTLKPNALAPYRSKAMIG